jgi:hypothetical protein
MTGGETVKMIELCCRAWSTHMRWDFGSGAYWLGWMGSGYEDDM